MKQRGDWVWRVDRYHDKSIFEHNIEEIFPKPNIPNLEWEIDSFNGVLSKCVRNKLSLNKRMIDDNQPEDPTKNSYMRIYADVTFA